MASAHRGQATFPSDPGPILSSLKTRPLATLKIILLIEHEKELSGGPPLQSNIAAREPYLSSLSSSISSYLLSLHLFLFHPFSVSLPTVLSSGCRFVCLPFSHLLSLGVLCFTFNSFSYFLRLPSFSLLVKIRVETGS
jgi:hypothetical protein